MPQSPDEEFIEQTQLILQEIATRLLTAEAKEDHKHARYLRGIYRGAEMVQEAYFTCLKITLEENPPNESTSPTEGTPVLPSGSPSGDPA